MLEVWWRTRWGARGRTAALATWLIAAGAAAWPAPSAAGGVVKCSAICTGNSGTCTVKPSVPKIPPGTVLDCAARDVVLAGFTTLKVEDGSFKLVAASLVVPSTSALKAVAVRKGGELGIEIATSGTVAVYGSLQADGAGGGGRIVVDAGGDILIANDGNNGVEASGTSAGADGGEIELTAKGTLVVQNPVRAQSAASGDVVGGEIRMNADGDVAISSPSARISVNGSKSDAGAIEVTAGRNLAVFDGAKLEADSRYAGGKGGNVTLTAAGRIEVASQVSARGSVEDYGNSSSGGAVTVDAGCGGVRIDGLVDLRGGEFGGGSLEVETMGDLVIAPGVVLDVRGTGYGGSGGDVRLAAGRTLELERGVLVDARADTTYAKGEGRAGSVELLGCELDAAAGVKVVARGRRGGAITLSAASDGDAQPTTLHIDATSVFDTTSTASPRHGPIRVAVAAEALTGRCTTDPDRACAVDAPDCTIGFTPGQCRGLNPDTDDTIAQFVVRPEIVGDSNLTGCARECR